MDVCLRVLKESNKRRFDSYSVWNSVLIISHITFRERRVHIFADNLSRRAVYVMSTCAAEILFAAFLQSDKELFKKIVGKYWIENKNDA